MAFEARASLANLKRVLVAERVALCQDLLLGDRDQIVTVCDRGVNRLSLPHSIVPLLALDSSRDGTLLFIGHFLRPGWQILDPDLAGIERLADSWRGKILFDCIWVMKQQFIPACVEGI